MPDETKTITKLVPAAQYIRMSTENQRFSPSNQRAANAAYALEKGFQIVATYQDSGKSGLTLKGRPALKRLLSDVLSGTACYRAVLVLDVSRWGRFQDADQAAHYEYMCREAGIPVKYCSEAFDNDGGAMASIVKHMKRVMAAEYSRELSTKVSRAQRQQAKFGYKQGGPIPLGVRRQLVDRNGKPRQLLAAGERKSLSSEKVILVAGPTSELRLVRKIFEMYVSEEMRVTEIVEFLKKKRAKQPNGHLWSADAIRNLLKNEIYIGTYVFGRRRSNLGNPRPSPPDEWVRSQVMEPIVEPSLFAASLERLERTSFGRYSDEQVIDGLQRLLLEKGALSRPLIRACSYLPTPCRLAVRYGSIAKTYELVGYKRPCGQRHVTYLEQMTEEEALGHLNRIFAVHGCISQRLINLDVSLPNARYFKMRFGGLPAAYALAGIPLSSTGRHDDIELRNSPKRKTRWGRNKNCNHMTDEDLLDQLRRLLDQHGYLSEALINTDFDLPNGSFYRERFGGILEAYKKVGFSSDRNSVVRAGFARRRAGTGVISSSA